jgi:general secretion pathway protein G
LKRRIPSRTKRGGFTLLELLLVLVILVVIAGFGIQAFGGVRDRAKINQAKVELGLLSQSLKRYEMLMNGLPTALEALSVKPSDADAEWVKMLDKPIAKDPWGTPYEYKPNGSEFELKSMGPDRQSGTADDIAS